MINLLHKKTHDFIKNDTLTKDPKQQGFGWQIWGQHSGGNKIARHGLWVRLGTSWFWGQVAFHKGLPNGVHIESYGLWPTWVLEAHRQFEYQGIAGLPHPKQKTTKFTPQSYCHQIIPTIFINGIPHPLRTASIWPPAKTQEPSWQDGGQGKLKS